MALHHGVGGLRCCGNRAHKENSPHRSLSLEMCTKALLHLLRSVSLEFGIYFVAPLAFEAWGEDAQLRKVANAPPWRRGLGLLWQESAESGSKTWRRDEQASLAVVLTSQWGDLACKFQS